MPSPVRLYQSEMHDNLGFYANWLPGDDLAVGDVGTVRDGRFRRETSLTELGVECRVQPGGVPQNVEYTSTQGIKITPSGEAAVAANLKAEIAIDFSREGAFVFHAFDLQANRLANPAGVGAGIVSAYGQGNWRKEWLLVEMVHSAKRATIIVAAESSAGLVLRAEVAGPIASLFFADPKIGFSVAATRGRTVRVVGEKLAAPLYSCLRLEDSLFGRPKMSAVRGAGSEDGPALARPGINELLDS